MIDEILILAKNFKKIASQQWVAGSPLTDLSGKPIPLYHGTGTKFNRFSLKKSTMGIIWFTSNRSEIESNDGIGAEGRGHIITANINLNNPAGWKEYDKYYLEQLKQMGYDGAILSHGDFFHAFVFNPNQIKIKKRDVEIDKLP